HSDADLVGARRWRIRAEHLEGGARLQVGTARPSRCSPPLGHLARSRAACGRAVAREKFDLEKLFFLCSAYASWRSGLRHARPPGRGIAPAGTYPRLPWLQAGWLG